MQQGICQVVYATLFVFDMMIAKVGGKKWFAGLVNEFCASAGQPTRQTILKRWRVIKDYL